MVFKNLSIFTLSFLLIFSPVSYSIAHEHEDSQSDSPYIPHTLEYHQLVETLETVIKNSERFGVPITSEQEKLIAEKLLNSVHQNMIEHGEKLGAQGLDQIIWSFLKKNIFLHFNYIKLGRWIIDTARKNGPPMAIALAVSEISENLLYFYVAAYPKLAVLLPLSWFHAVDVVAYGLVIGTPTVYQRLKTYNRFGDLRTGARRYYEFLVEQKKVLPLDWSEVLDIQTIKINFNTEVTETDIVILKKSLWDRFIPKKLEYLLIPHRLAQKNTSNALSISDLESISKKLKIKLYIFKGLPSIPALYSRILLKEILSHDLGTELIISKLELNGRIKTSNIKSSPLDSNAILAAADPDELKKIKDESAVTLAQRLLWYLQFQMEEIINSKTAIQADLKNKFKLIREINKIISKDLLLIAESKTDENSYQRLFEIKEQILEKLKILLSDKAACFQNLQAL